MSPADIYNALAANLGSDYVNDFNPESHVFHVIVQDEAQFRNRVDEIGQLYVTSASGAQVPLRTLITLKTVRGANAITRFNLYPAVLINGQAGGGVVPARR